MPLYSTLKKLEKFTLRIGRGTCCDGVDIRPSSVYIFSSCRLCKLQCIFILCVMYCTVQYNYLFQFVHCTVLKMESFFFPVHNLAKSSYISSTHTSDR
jgi:hypothetical protein